MQSHFEDSQFESHRLDGKKKLRWNAVPTLFNVPNPPKPVTLRRKRPSSSPLRFQCSDRSCHEHSYCKKVVADSVVSVDADGDCVDDVNSIEDAATKADSSCNIHTLQSLQQLKRKVKQLTQELNRQRKKNSHLVANLKRFLTPEQIQYLNLPPKSARTIRWSDETIKRCLQLRYTTGRKGYAHLRRLGYPVPAYRTLCNRVVNAEFRPGLQTDVLHWLSVKMASQSSSFKDCSLALDEMQLRPCVEYDKGNYNTLVARCSS